MGPLDGVRVVQLAHEYCAFAGRLLAGLGAEVIAAEPPGGSRQRTYEPFLDDQPGLERSLWWWHYYADCASVVIDLDTAAGLDHWRTLVAGADIVLEAEPPGRLAELGVDHDELRRDAEWLSWVSVTPYGRNGPRADWQATDLTVLADGGPAWSCGYDDHTLPPVRGGGNQGYHTASIFAVMSALTAVLARDHLGYGQFIDVSMHAAANVTTEAGSYEYLVAGDTVMRQTCRHANVEPSVATHVQGTDGIYVNTGFPPQTADRFRALIEWLDELGLSDQVTEGFFLEMGIERGHIHLSELFTDPEARAIFGAARDAVKLIAANLPAREFFTGMQERNIAVGIIYSPEETMQDPHFVARGFPVSVHHDDLGRSFDYPGAPWQFSETPWVDTRRAPHVGEHQHLLRSDDSTTAEVQAGSTQQTGPTNA